MPGAYSERSFTLERLDGERLTAYHWSGGATPRAILVVAHGMGEHARRYPPALAALIDDGIDLYGIDHRGHGGSIALSDREAGDFGPGGFDAVVGDLDALVVQARSEWPDIPLMLLGHSMGSFIAQAYFVQYWCKLDALVLVGTSALDVLAAKVMAEADVGAALNRNFEPARTPFDWLSTDTGEVDRYLADPLCGFSLTLESMVGMLNQAGRLADAAALALIRKGFPIYVLVGERDPLGTNLGSVAPLVQRYRAAGLDVELCSYPEGRHEILNERNRTEVVSALRAWLNQVVIRRKN